MSKNEKNDNGGIVDVFEDDESLDIRNLIDSTIKSNSQGKVSLDVEENKKEENLTPLQKMQRDKEKNTAGIVVSNKELEDGKAKAPSKDIVLNEDRLDEFEKTEDELDESLRRRKAVVILKVPQANYNTDANGIENSTNNLAGAEYAQLMTEINSIRFNSSGEAYYDYKDENGNPIKPVFTRLRTKDDPPYSDDELQLVDPSKSPNNISSNNDINTEVEIEDEDNEISEKTRNTVKVIIDKTGLGADFAFTEAEKEKLEQAEVIQINEVKKIDIAAIKSKRSDKSFQEIIKEYDYSDSRTTMCLPASGLKVQMKGMTYGEFADVALSMENITVDHYYKRLSVLYNKMTNISTGPFKDFEDFLKHIAYTDISLAIYGLFISTEEEDQEIELRCGNRECNKHFNWKYNTRSIIRLDRCADTFLDKMKELAQADAADYDKIQQNSAVLNSHYIELPSSKFIVEMGIASAYDFLYNFIPLMNEDTFREAFGADANEAYLNNVILLTSIRSVLVPTPDGKYVECRGYRDILDAIYNVSPDEIKILTSYTSKLQDEYQMVFSFGNVVCPHCGNITRNLDISMDDLVFQIYQRLMNSEVSLETTLNS